MSELMSTKTEIGRDNVYYEMEYKGEDDAETYEKVIVKNESPQELLRERAQPYKDSGEVKSRYFLVAVTAIAVASFLTAAATVVLAFAKTDSRSDVSTTRDSIASFCEMSEISKNLQELKKNISALTESSVSKKLRELDVALADVKRELEITKKKVDQELKSIWQAVKQTEGSLLNKTNSSLQDFENKVNSEIKVVSLKLNETVARGDYLSSSLESHRKNITNIFGKLELRVKMEEEKSSYITKSSDHHSKLIQHLTDMLNDTREDMRNMSREQSTALELAQNSTVTELVRVRMLVDSTQTILLTQFKKMHGNMTEKVTKETEKLETRIEIVENKSNNTKQVTDQHHNRIQQIEELLNLTRKNMKEESKKYFTALWLTGNSTKMDLQSISMVLNVTRGNIVRQLKEVQDNLTEQVKDVSRMPGPIGPPGYNGSQGPVGPQGAVGPAGPKGSGDFGQCQFKTKSADTIPGNNRILVHADEPTNKKIMAVTCSTDYGSEYNLISRVQANVRRYVCTCNGKSTLFNGGSSCYLHYWICPLTT